jgi:hypothetical protein
MADDAHAEPVRCGAKTRAGHPCGRYAMVNGRCRMHGGLSTGPRTPEGLERSRKARWKHGRCSAEAIAKRRENSQILRLMRELIDEAE